MTPTFGWFSRFNIPCSRYYSAPPRPPFSVSSEVVLRTPRVAESPSLRVASPSHDPVSEHSVYHFSAISQSFRGGVEIQNCWLEIVAHPGNEYLQMDTSFIKRINAIPNPKQGHLTPARFILRQTQDPEQVKRVEGRLCVKLFLLRLSLRFRGSFYAARSLCTR